MKIRNAETDDLPGIVEIYNEVIATSTAVYSQDPVSVDDRREWMAARAQLGYPVLVAALGAKVLGFASFGDWRAWPGYRYTVEHSVHIRAGERGQGTGRALVESLFPLASALGKHVMIGGIDASNQASIRFHERLGFVQSGTFREVGHKFGRWLDVVFVHRFLDEAGSLRP